LSQDSGKKPPQPFEDQSEVVTCCAEDDVGFITVAALGVDHELTSGSAGQAGSHRYQDQREGFPAARDPADRPTVFANG